MRFLHTPWGDSITRAQALKGLAALTAMPIMPSISGVPSAQDLNAGRDLTAIFGSTALLGSDLTPLRDATILMRGERIEAVGPAREIAIPAAAFRIDATGLFTIPGLIDSHVHFFASGDLYTRPDKIDLRSIRPYSDEVGWIRSNLQDTFARYLRAGITSVVDAGGPFWNYNVRTQSRQTLVSPRLMVAGPLVSNVDRGLLDLYDDPPIVKVDSVEGARALIDRQITAQTDFVALLWIATPQQPAAAFQPIANAAIEYAHSRGARVITHATQLETARLAVTSGTDILAHGVFDTDVDDAFLELLRSRKVVYCPTLLAPSNYGYTLAGRPKITSNDLRVANPDALGTLFNLQDIESALPADTLERIRTMPPPEPPYAAMRNLKRVANAGIPIAAGTDAGNIGTQHASSYYDEALEMVASGLSPKDVLLAATRGGAEMTARSSDLGTIERGRLADLAILRANPLDEIAALGAVKLVVKGGRVFDAAGILNETPEQIVQRQINAYNSHDAQVFAESYSEDAVVQRPSTYVRTRAAIASAYSDFFARNPQLHVEIVDRNSNGETVVDKEHVTGFANGGALDATVTYTVTDGAIVRAEAT